MEMQLRWKLSCLIFVTWHLFSCGGGGGDAAPQTTEPPAPTPETSFGIDDKFETKDWSGNFNVATTTFAWEDPNREEPHTVSPDDSREIHVRLFYPTDREYTENKLALLSPQFWQRLGSESVISGKKLRQANYADAQWQVEIDAPLSELQPTFPLIIFSNGYGLSPEDHVSLTAELASRGYIVASVNHPFGSGVTTLLDGQTVNSQRLPENNLGANLQLWSDDQIFVLNQLQELSTLSSSMLFGRLDHRIGAMGHSYGGAAAYYSAWQDIRILAAINLDGTVFNREGKDIVQPFMYLQNNGGYDLDIFEQVGNDGYAVIFNHAIRHLSFADYVLFWAWDFPANNPFGPMDAEAAHMFFSDISDEFFAKYFNASDTTILDGNTALPHNISITKY